jgi:hypothetical protein
MILKDGLGTYLIQDTNIPKDDVDNLVISIEKYTIDRENDSNIELIYKENILNFRKLSNSMYNFLLKDQEGNILSDLKGVCLFDVAITLRLVLNISQEDSDGFYNELIEIPKNSESYYELGNEDICLEINNESLSPVSDNNFINLISETIAEQIVSNISDKILKILNISKD